MPHARNAGVTQFAERPSFNLADSFASDTEFFADFRKSHRMIVDTKASTQHFFFAFFKASKLFNQGALFQSGSG